MAWKFSSTRSIKTPNAANGKLHIKNMGYSLTYRTHPKECYAYCDAEKDSNGHLCKEMKLKSTTQGIRKTTYSCESSDRWDS